MPDVPTPPEGLETGPSTLPILVMNHQTVMPPDLQTSYFRDVIYLSPISLLVGYVDTVYSQVLIPYGGNAPYTIAVGSGSLPDGLTINGTTGVVSGTPTTVGVSGFTLVVTDVGGKTNTLSYSIRIMSSPVESGTSGVSPSIFPNAVISGSYSQLIVPYGGTAPYAFAVITGSLPPGITLNTSTGELSGTSTAAGVYNFVIQVTDDAAAVTSRSYNIVVENTSGGGGGGGSTYTSDLNFTS
jgi:large repetitive protein